VENCGNVRWRGTLEFAGRAWGYGNSVREGSGGTPGVRACSACAGDYEDPERTAAGADEPDDEEGEALRPTPQEEFPAEE
jgi:hypothetical protein